MKVYHESGVCTCDGPMWLRGFRIGNLKVRWGNGHHARGSDCGYRPFGIGPWLQFQWCPPPRSEVIAGIKRAER